MDASKMVTNTAAGGPGGDYGYNQPAGVSPSFPYQPPNGPDHHAAVAPAPPVSFQPLSMATNQSNVTVVMSQPQAEHPKARLNLRDWDVGLCGCGRSFSCGHCTLSFLCPAIAALCYAQQMGEPCCSAYCMACCSGPSGIASMRTKLRVMLGISGTLHDDHTAACCCGPCALCQMKQEMDTYAI